MRIIPTLSLAAFASLSASCSIDMPMQSCWFTDFAVVEGRTESRVETLTVTPAMEHLTVDVDVRCDGGAANWSLIDPDGVCRWRSATDAAQHSEQHLTLDARPGTWIARREWHDFSGSQSLSVAAASQERVKITLSEVRVAEH
jgi:hypothetical protein